MATDRRAVLAVVVVATVALTAGCGGGHKAARSQPAPPTTEGTTTTTAYPYVAPTAPPGPTATTTTPRGGPPTTSHRRAPVPPGAAPGAEKAALARLVSAYPARSSVTSDIIQSGSQSYVAVGHNVGGLTALIDIYVYHGSRFVDVAPNVGAGQNLDPVDPTAIRAANITGTPFPDFLVPLAAGDHDNGVLVSYVGGIWQLIGVSERTGAAASDELVQPNIVGNEVTQSVNDCSPTCAQGTYSVTTYLFDPQMGKLVAYGPTVQSPRAA